MSGAEHMNEASWNVAEVRTWWGAMGEIKALLVALVVGALVFAVALPVIAGSAYLLDKAGAVMLAVPIALAPLLIFKSVLTRVNRRLVRRGWGVGAVELYSDYWLVVWRNGYRQDFDLRWPVGVWRYWFHPGGLGYGRNAFIWIQQGTHGAVLYATRTTTGGFESRSDGIRLSANDNTAMKNSLPSANVELEDGDLREIDALLVDKASGWAQAGA